MQMSGDADAKRRTKKCFAVAQKFRNECRAIKRGREKTTHVYASLVRFRSIKLRIMFQFRAFVATHRQNKNAATRVGRRRCARRHTAKAATRDGHDLRRRNIRVSAKTADARWTLLVAIGARRARVKRVVAAVGRRETTDEWKRFAGGAGDRRRLCRVERTVAAVTPEIVGGLQS